MTPEELKKMREDGLGMTQQELASALNVSFATVNRWESKDERTRRPIPQETERLLESIKELLEKPSTSATEASAEEVREAVKAVGVEAVVARAVAAGKLAEETVMRLARSPALKWVSGISAVGAILGACTTLGFFEKLSMLRPYPSYPKKKSGRVSGKKG